MASPAVAHKPDTQEMVSPEERKKFLEKAPPPARLAFRLFGQRRYAAEVAALRQGIIPHPRRG